MRRCNQLADIPNSRLNSKLSISLKEFKIYAINVKTRTYLKPPVKRMFFAEIWGHCISSRYCCLKTVHN